MEKTATLKQQKSFYQSSSYLLDDDALSLVLSKLEHLVIYNSNEQPKDNHERKPDFLD